VVVRHKGTDSGIHAGLDGALIDQAGVRYSPDDVEQGFQQQGLLAGEIATCSSTGHTRRFRRRPRWWAASRHAARPGWPRPLARHACAGADSVVGFFLLDIFTMS